MAKIYGYCRISTKKQRIERQIENILAAYPEAKGNIFQEAFTGTKVEGREQLKRLIKKVESGDTIVFDEVSRMSRNAEEGFAQYQDFFNKGINLVFLKEPHINTDTYKEAMQSKTAIEIDTGDSDADEMVNDIMSAVTKYMFRLTEKQIQLAFAQAQKEVDYLQARTKEGLRVAKAKGSQIGHYTGQKIKTKKGEATKEVIKKHSHHFYGSLNDTDCMKLAGVSRNTYYRYKKELAEELRAEEENK